jgi:ribosomal protein L15
MSRRLPKRGFHVPDRTEYREVTLNALARIEQETVTPEILRETGLVKGRGPVVILGKKGPGEITLKVKSLSVHRITGPARTAVEAAGGAITILELDAIDRRVKKGPKPKPKKKAAAATG